MKKKSNILFKYKPSDLVEVDFDLTDNISQYLRIYKRLQGKLVRILSQENISDSPYYKLKIDNKKPAISDNLYFVMESSLIDRRDMDKNIELIKAL